MSQAQQMLKHSSIYAVGNISRQLVGFIMLPVYTHYLTPADYGVIGLLVFLVSLFEIMLGGHMFQAVPKYYHQEETKENKNKVVSTAFIVTTFFSGTACLIMSIFSTPISEITFGEEKYSIYVVIFSGLILTHALELYSLTYIRIKKRPWTFFNFSMAKLALQLTLNILLIVVYEMGLMGLALSSLISSIIMALILTAYTISGTGIRFNKGVARKIIIFSWPLWISGLIGLYIGSSNKYFIRVFSSLDDVGLYELASKFGFIGMMLIWSPFSQYWQTERFAIAKTENPYPAYSLAFRLIASLMILSGLSIILFSEIIIEIMSDQAFHSSTDAVPFLVIACIFQSLTIFNNFSFMYTSRTFEITKNNIVTALLTTVFYFVLIPSYGFVGAAVALAAGSIIQYLYALNRGNQCYSLKIRQLPFGACVIIISALSLIDGVLDIQDLKLSISLKLTLFILGIICTTLILFNKKELFNTYCAIKARKKRAL